MLQGVKRVYDRREIADGKRILVDRLWPRGVKKSTQNVDTWMKDVAPSNELRKWFDHDPVKWEEFKQRYRKELQDSKAFDELVELVKKADVTLIYSAKETQFNNAVALSEFIAERLGS